MISPEVLVVSSEAGWARGVSKTLTGLEDGVSVTVVEPSTLLAGRNDGGTGWTVRDARLLVVDVRSPDDIEQLDRINDEIPWAVVLAVVDRQTGSDGIIEGYDTGANACLTRQEDLHDTARTLEKVVSFFLHNASFPSSSQM